MLHPRYKRYIKKTLSFGFIWLIFGLAYVLLEAGLLGNLTEYPTTGNNYDFKSSLIYTSIGTFLIGLLQGWIEVSWLGRRLSRFSFREKIALKSIFYLTFIIIFFVLLTLIINAQHFNTSIFDPLVLDSLRQFIQKFAFWSIVLYTGIILDVAIFYSEMREYLGSNGVLYNYAFGKYHRPKQEIRIFMFLDMKSSTTIAEKIGHEKYFHLLKTYYADMTDGILETSGEIYQYVGDEIVVTWTKKKGIYANNCIRCLIKISRTINQKREDYHKTFGLVPEFKAGYHIGQVTTGEIGIIKKDIIHTGDVLNTTARIQAQCNRYDAKALISRDLLEELQKEDPISFTQIGELILRGKKEPIQLYSVAF